MGATSTLSISRRDAAASLAAIEFAKLTDQEIQDRLNTALENHGYHLSEVSVGNFSSRSDLDELENITGYIACYG